MKLDAVIRREPSFLECRFSGDRKAWCNDQSDKNRLQNCFDNTHGQFPPSGSVRRFEGTACNCKEYHDLRPAQRIALKNSPASPVVPYDQLCNDLLSKNALLHGVSYGSVAAFVTYVAPAD